MQLLALERTDPKLNCLEMFNITKSYNQFRVWTEWVVIKATANGVHFANA